MEVRNLHLSRFRVQGRFGSRVVLRLKATRLIQKPKRISNNKHICVQVEKRSRETSTLRDLPLFFTLGFLWKIVTLPADSCL